MRWLHRKTDNGKPIAELVRGRTIGELRQAARDWQITHQANVAAERQLATDQSPDGYLRWAGRVAGRGRRRGFLRSRSRTRPPVTPKVTPVDVLLAVGPSASPRANMMMAMRTGAVLGVPAAVFMTWLTLHTYPDRLPSLSASIVTDVLSNLAWNYITYIFGAAVLGVLWQHIPGSRGPIKALVVGIGYACVPIANYFTPRLVGGFASTEPLVDALLFAAVMMIVGVRLDATTLRSASDIWIRPRRTFFAAYGLQNLPSQLTFAVAQLITALAIYNFLRYGGSAPAASPVDPSVIARLNSSH
jgi:hypothetical protein